MDFKSPFHRHFAVVGIVLGLIASVSTNPLNLSNEKSSNASSAIDLAATQVLDLPFPYDFPKEDAPMNLFPMPKCAGVTLEEATIDQLQDAMNSGLLTTSQLVLCYLQRIYQTDMYLGYVSYLLPCESIQP